MRFEVTQRFAHPVAAVAEALCDPDWFATLASAPKLAAPAVLDRSVDGRRVTMRVRYRFTGELNAAARAALDPERLTWVEETVHDLASSTATFVLHPDHYADRFSCHGGFTLVAAPGDATSALRAADGDVKVRAPLVGSTVERAIISGLREHLEAESALMDSFLGGR